MGVREPLLGGGSGIHDTSDGSTSGGGGGLCNGDSGSSFCGVKQASSTYHLLDHFINATLQTAELQPHQQRRLRAAGLHRAGPPVDRHGGGEDVPRRRRAQQQHFLSLTAAPRRENSRYKTKPC